MNTTLPKNTAATAVSIAGFAFVLVTSHSLIKIEIQN